MKVTHKGEVGFAVQPKLDCPHLTEQIANTSLTFFSTLKVPLSDQPCHQCKDSSENWVCLICAQVLCSRYVKGHMAEHNSVTGHFLAVSFSDGSYWCYSCDSYIESALLRDAQKQLSKVKIEEEKAVKEAEQAKEKSEHEALQELQKMVQKFDIKEKTVTFDDIATGLKQKKYKKILVLTGAGLSVAAGIPDFRSPGTGLYSKLAAYNLPYPEAIFELSYFKKNPKAFLTLSKELLTGDYEPTLGHRFIYKLQEEGILLMNMTQNIDDLESKAGIKEEKLLQAHGHSRSAQCTGCKGDADIAKWRELAAKQQPFYCKCGGIVKPNIVFFGQSLPKQFHSAPQIVKKCDLAIIIGTSLKVHPFAQLSYFIPEEVPAVLINREDVLQRDNKLWLEGDIQQNIKKLMEAAGWAQK